MDIFVCVNFVNFCRYKIPEIINFSSNAYAKIYIYLRDILARKFKTREKLNYPHTKISFFIELLIKQRRLKLFKTIYVYIYIYHKCYPVLYRSSRKEECVQLSNGQSIVYAQQHRKADTNLTWVTLKYQVVYN